MSFKVKPSRIERKPYKIGDEYFVFAISKEKPQKDLLRFKRDQGKRK
jgi:hypothetical protein